MSEECRAEKCKWKHPHKRFCIHEHDTFLTGRSTIGECLGCRQARGQRPEEKAKRREYDRRPFRLARRREHDRQRYHSPVRQAAMRAADRRRRQKPERQVYMAEYQQQRYQQMPFEKWHGRLLRERRQRALKRLEQAVGASD